MLRLKLKPVMKYWQYYEIDSYTNSSHMPAHTYIHAYTYVRAYVYLFSCMYACYIFHLNKIAFVTERLHILSMLPIKLSHVVGITNLFVFENKLQKYLRSMYLG